MNRTTTWTSVAAAAIFITATAAHAQSWPSRPIRMVVAAAPGGTADLTARLIVDRLGAALGQPVIIDNKPGAGGNVAADLVAHAPADGYTMLLNSSGMTTNQNLYAHLPYDTIKDFEPVSLVIRNAFAVTVPAASPATSFADFVARAKAPGSRISYSSSGQGQGNHLGMEWLKKSAGFEAVHVPYGGSGPATTALLSNTVEVSMPTIAAIAPYTKPPAKLRALAVTGTKRSPLLPDVPTLGELGYPNIVVLSWQGLWVPAGTPRAIIDRIQRETAIAIKQADILPRLQAADLEPVGSTLDEFAAFIRGEITTWAKVIKDSGAKAE